jgi:carboxylate-amine ligase
MSAAGVPPDAGAIRQLLDHERPPSIGVEEELMLLDPQSLDLSPRAAELLDRLPQDAGYKLELPAAQLEQMTTPCGSVGDVVEQLFALRKRLNAALAEEAVPVAAGAHAFASALGQLNSGDRYARIEREYGVAIRAQLICGLHIHVALAGAARVLAVYNALRSYLPELAALGANAPLYQGQDTGMASVRPLVAGLLPRQGVPPAFADWEEFAGSLAWAARGGRIGGAREWWWELRVHPEFGTLEIRVPDAQTTVAQAGALAAVGAGLILYLAARHDAGDLPAPAPSWRIAENSWSAARHGVHGQLVDLETGEAVPTRRRLRGLLDELAPFAPPFGAEPWLERAGHMVEHNGADSQRDSFASDGVEGVMRRLGSAFLDAP